MANLVFLTEEAVNAKVAAVRAEAQGSDIRMLHPVTAESVGSKIADSAFSVFRVPEKGRTIVGGYDGAIYCAVDGSPTVKATISGQPAYKARLQDMKNIGGTLYATTTASDTKGVFRSADGVTWTACGLGTPAPVAGTLFYGICRNPVTGIYAVATVGNAVNGSGATTMNPFCMFSDDGVTFSAGPSISISYAAHAVCPYGDGFVFSRDVQDGDGQLFTCSGIRRNGSGWSWDDSYMIPFNAREVLGVMSGDLDMHSLAYGNGGFAVGSIHSGKVAFVRPDGTYRVATLPGSSDACRHISFADGVFYIAGYGSFYATSTFEDLHDLGYGLAGKASKCYGVDASGATLYAGVKDLGAYAVRLAPDKSVGIGETLGGYVDFMFSDGERVAF